MHSLNVGRPEGVIGFPDAMIIVLDWIGGGSKSMVEGRVLEVTSDGNWVEEADGCDAEAGGGGACFFD